MCHENFQRIGKGFPVLIGTKSAKFNIIEEKGPDKGLPNLALNWVPNETFLDQEIDHPKMTKVL